jgi:hypothetical protein
VFVALVSCSAEAQVASFKSVRDVPWQNWTYDFGGATQDRFVDGRYADEEADGTCNVCMGLMDVSFGDVDADGREEAAVVIGTNLGGAGTLIDGYVYGLVAGKVTLRASIEGGDRGGGGIQSIRIQRGKVIVRRFDLSPSDGVCCPSRISIETWRWVGDALVRVGRPRSEAWPARSWRRPPVSGRSSRAPRHPRRSAARAPTPPSRTAGHSGS